MTPMVKAESVCKSFGALDVLKGITLEIGKGEVLVMVGPSGSGKSTFLRCINHLEQVNAGRLYVDGELIGYRDKGAKLYEMSPRDALQYVQGAKAFADTFGFHHRGHGWASPSCAFANASSCLVVNFREAPRAKYLSR